MKNPSKGKSKKPSRVSSFQDKTEHCEIKKEAVDIPSTFYAKKIFDRKSDLKIKQEEMLPFTIKRERMDFSQCPVSHSVHDAREVVECILNEILSKLPIKQSEVAVNYGEQRVPEYVPISKPFTCTDSFQEVPQHESQFVKEETILSGNIGQKSLPLANLVFSGPFDDPFQSKPRQIDNEESVFSQRHDWIYAEYNTQLEALKKPPIEVSLSMLKYQPLDAEVPLHPRAKPRMSAMGKEAKPSTSREKNAFHQEKKESDMVFWDNADVNARAEGEVDLWELLGGGNMLFRYMFI
ncbi:MAG: hypothetical protein HQK53_16580 [Oligoflexia bacterium]|nr:hypothetical protein [Oligoflexia bacterium]